MFNYLQLRRAAADVNKTFCRTQTAACKWSALDFTCWALSHRTVITSFEYYLYLTEDLGIGDDDGRLEHCGQKYFWLFPGAGSDHCLCLLKVNIFMANVLVTRVDQSRESDKWPVENGCSGLVWQCPEQRWPQWVPGSGDWSHVSDHNVNLSGHTWYRCQANIIQHSINNHNHQTHRHPSTSSVLPSPTLPHQSYQQSWFDPLSEMMGVINSISFNFNFQFLRSFDDQTEFQQLMMCWEIRSYWLRLWW